MNAYQLPGVELFGSLELLCKPQATSTFLMMVIGGGSMGRKWSRAIRILGKSNS